MLTKDARDAMPDWTAVFLLATLAAHRPDLLTGVEPTAWASWGPVITVVQPFGVQENWQRRIRDAAPETGRDAIDQALREQIRRADVVSFAHHPLADFSDRRVIAVLEQVARDTNQPAERRDEALGGLSAHEPALALDIARTAIIHDAGPPSAFAALAKLAPNELVERWISQGRINPAEPLKDLDTDRLSDTSLVALTSMLLHEFPFADDPVPSQDFAESTPAAVARRLRMSLLQLMARRGMAPHLSALGHGIPAADFEYIRRLLQEARTREALANWRPVQPGLLMNLLPAETPGWSATAPDCSQYCLSSSVKSNTLSKSVAPFDACGTTNPALPVPRRRVKTPSPTGWPSSWTYGSNPHVVIDREIQVTRPKSTGFGTRIDLTATSAGVHLGRVAFEAKLVDNPSLLTAIDTQLVGQYMKPAAITHGIYIVYRSASELRKSNKHPDADALAAELREQAERHLPDKQIEIVVFDIGPKT